MEEAQKSSGRNLDNVQRHQRFQEDNQRMAIPRNFKARRRNTYSRGYQTGGFAWYNIKMDTTRTQNIISEWLSWHFYEMPKFLLGVWKNYILFASNYFSLPTLLLSLFAPWRRYKWSYPKWFNIGEFLSTVISNAFSRFLGALMRIALIIVGILFQIFVIFAGLVIFIFWILTPFIIIAGLLFALIY